MIWGTLRVGTRILSVELPTELSITCRHWLPNLWEQTSTLSWLSHHLRSKQRDKQPRQFPSS